ncbi:MAG: hypothetical protein WA139_05505 [Candidatus Aenigmatarchaeota archaeon]
MKIDKKTFLPPALIFGVFTLAVASLAFSGLSAGNAVSMQNELMAIFLKSVQSSIVAAMADSAFFILQKIILPLLPFLLLSALGFSAVLWFKPDTKKLAAALAASAACVLALSLVMNITPAILIISLGYFALLLPIEFEERKTIFKTGYAFSSYMLRYLNIAVVVAVFAAILTMPDFDKSAEQQMISGVSILLPDIGQLQQAQNDAASSFVTQASASVNNIIDSEYSLLATGKRMECSQFKDNVKTKVDSYKSQLLSQFQSGNASIGTEQLAKDVFSKVGVFSAMAKATPLIAALSLLALLELIKPLLALAGGAVYSLLNKRFGK